MFESLTNPESDRRHFTQPFVAFAVHVGVIAAVWGIPVEPAQVPDPRPKVIYIPAGPGPTPKVPSGGTGVIAAPVDGPGPIGAVPGPLPAASGPAVDLATGTLGKLPRLRDPGFGTQQPVDSTVHLESELTDSPEVLRFPEPVYPAGLRHAGIGGAVHLTYVIDTQGHVEPGSVMIVSSDHPAMAESVRRSLGQAVFRPGKVRGQPVRVLVRQTVRFRTDDTD